MPYFLLLAFHLKIGNSFFVFTTRTPFTSQTKWQMSYNFLYCENVEKLLPNRSIKDVQMLPMVEFKLYRCSPGVGTFIVDYEKL